MSKLRFKGGRQPSHAHAEVIQRKAADSESLMAQLQELQSAPVSSAERELAVFTSDEAEGKEHHARELLADESLQRLPADRLIAALAARESANDEEDRMLSRYLAAARWAKSDTGDITNRGDDDKELEAADYDDSHYKPGEYTNSVAASREEMMGDFLRSARIVKRNKQRIRKRESAG